jgi:hypothetical protein
MRARITAGVGAALWAVALTAVPARGEEASVRSPEVVAPTDPRLGDTGTSGAPLAVEDLPGMAVFGEGDKRLGEVADVLVGRDGQPARLVIEAGPGAAPGKLVSVEASRAAPRTGDSLRVDGLDEREIGAAPPAEEDPTVAALGGPAPGPRVRDR